MEPSFHLTRQPRTWWHTGCVMYEHARVHEHYLYINVNAPPHPTNPPEPHFCGTVRDPSAPGGICHELSIQKIRYFSDAKKTRIQLNMVLSSISNTRLWDVVGMSDDGASPEKFTLDNPICGGWCGWRSSKNMSVNHETKYEIMMYLSKRAVLMNWVISSVHVCSC